jgi:histone H3/H4
VLRFATLKLLKIPFFIKSSYMKKSLYTFLLLLVFLTVLTADKSKAAPAITLTTPTIAAANVNQGTNGVIVYAVKMKVSNTAVTVNNIQFKLSGNYDNNDLSYVYVYYNPTAPTLSGASYLTYSAATYAAPHTYSLTISRSLAVGEAGYFIISVNLSNTASDNKYIQINGGTDPVKFGYSVTSNVTNNQSNGVGKQTIQAADITLSAAIVNAANYNQGTTGVIVYAAKMKVSTEPLTVNNIQFKLEGTYNSSDLVYVYVYYNPTAPTLSGASYLTYSAANYAAPHTYSLNINRTLAVGEAGYFIISVNISNSGTDGKYMQINGDTNPVSFGFVTSPNITNNQANNAKKQTIQAADITLTSATIYAASHNQGTTGIIVYAAKMKVATEPVTVNNIQFKLGGNYDNNDLDYVYVYYNPSAPTLSGASYLTYSAATYSAPHTYSLNINRSLAVGEAGYFIISVNLNHTATDNKYIQINGDTDPVIFGYTTSPNKTNSQSNKAQKQTIQAADITLTTAITNAGNYNQGTIGVIVYAAKMKVATEPVTVNNIQFNLGGNYDNNDLDYVYVYYNPTAPTLSGASYLTYSTATYSAPHLYSLNINRSLAVGDAGYFIISVNINHTGSDSKYIQINGDTNPITFGFTTAPHVTNSQANNAKKQTIQAAEITLTTATTGASSIAKNSTGNIVYAAKMKVATEPVTVNNIQFNLAGSYDNDDLTYVYIYYNPSAPSLSGASYLTYAAATYSSPHTYGLNINRSLAIGEAGYFIISVNVSSTATTGHTVKINGATDPVQFGYTTGPIVMDNQANNAGAKTIAASFAKDGEISSEDMIAGKSSINLHKIFPNPANASFSFSLNGNKNENIIAQLTGRSGNILIEKNISVNKGLNQYTMKVSSFLSGVYYLVIINTNGEILSKQQVIIQH